jgi:error-prone DNA polymerase
MGFYRPEVVVHDAQRHGISVLPVDVNRSDAACRVESGGIRLGLQYVKEMGAQTLERIRESRACEPYRSLEDFCFRTGLPESVVENLVLAGGFDFCGASRRGCLSARHRGQTESGELHCMQPARGLCSRRIPALGGG